MKAVCTWGEGPDVLVYFDGTPVVLYEEPDKERWKFGKCDKGSFDLTAEEALELARQLTIAANNAIQMEKLCEQYFEQERIRETFGCSQFKANAEYVI